MADSGFIKPSAWIVVSPLANDNGSLVAQMVKSLTAVQETWAGFLGREDPLEKGMVTHTPVFWPGELHGLYSPWGLQRVGHDRATCTFI